MTTVLVATFSGLLGIGLGAWLNSMLATRKERWEFRRGLYCRLLEHLHVASIRLNTLIHKRDPQDLPALFTEIDEIRQARAVTRTSRPDSGC